MNTDLDFKIFKIEDFPEYLSWYQDPELNKHLGPMEEDDEWLTYLLNQQKGLTEFDGCTYSVFQNKKLVCVIGVEYPDDENPTCGISSFAVNPIFKRKGIGKKSLQKLLKLHPLKKGEYWIASVGEKNPKAKLFFENNGWKCVAEPPENNNMYLFEYRNN